MPDIRCIGICTGGGDAPGLNAVIRAAVKAAILKYKWKVIGIPDGFDGLIWPEKSRELMLKDVSGILPRGGTILGTTNRGNPFHYQTVENGKEVVRDISAEVIANTRKLGIDAIISIGGDGSQKIALEAGIAGGAHVILIPEIPFTIENICKYVSQRATYGKYFTIVVVAEGIKLPPELKENRRAGAVGNLIGNAIAASSHKEVRVSVLGHIQRGGSPSPFDRILATRFGVAAVDLIANGGFGKMVCLQQECIRVVDIAQAVGKLKTVDPQGEIVRAARAIGISFGD